MHQLAQPMLQRQIRQAFTPTTTSTGRSAIHRSIQVVSQHQVPIQQRKRLETLTLNLFPTPRSARTLLVAVRSRRRTLLDRRPQRSATLAIRALRLALRHEGAITTTVIVDASQPGGDIVAADGALEDGEGGQGLVVGYLVAGVVDAGEGEGAGLLGLAVDEAVRGADVDVARCWGAGG